MYLFYFVYVYTIPAGIWMAICHKYPHFIFQTMAHLRLYTRFTWTNFAYFHGSYHWPVTFTFRSIQSMDLVSIDLIYLRIFFLVNFRMYPQQSQETTTTRWLLSVGLSDRLKQVQALWPLNGIPKLKATGLNAILSATLMEIWRNMSYENEDWLFQMVKHHESPRFGLICCAAGSARRMRWQRRCTGNWATTWRATALSLSCRGATCETL